MVTVRSPAVMPNAPVVAMVTVTSSAAAGAGFAVSVKLALSPSVTPVPAATVTSGTDGSSSVIATLPEEAVPTV